MSIFKPLFKNKDSSSSYRIHMEDPESVSKIGEYLGLWITEVPSLREKTIIIVCIGSDRSTGDSFGPLVGTMLSRQHGNFFKVMGCLDTPVHAGNLNDYLNIIQSVENPYVLAVDACLGNLDSVGFINLGKGAVKPGAGVNKNLPPVGDLHITGIVNVGGFMEYFVLQNTRLSTVMKMAEIVSSGLEACFEKCFSNDLAVK